jgi:hypothetical protein
MDEHEHGKDDEVQVCQGFSQALIPQGDFLRGVVACQSPEAVDPSETALNHLATRQQHKAFFRLGQPDDLQLHAFVTCGLCSALNISRSSYRRCGASSLVKTRYGAAKLHSSSETSVG